MKLQERQEAHGTRAFVLKRGKPFRGEAIHVSPELKMHQARIEGYPDPGAGKWQATDEPQTKPAAGVNATDHLVTWLVN